MKISRQLLTLAGGMSFAAALFQAVLAFSPSLSAFFTAPPELVANPPLLLASGLAVTGILVVFGLYGLAGAGRIRSLPFMRVVLLAIGMGYTLYGLNFLFTLPYVLGIVPAPQPVPLQIVGVLFGALVTGLLYLAGTIAGWSSLRPGARAYAAH